MPSRRRRWRSPRAIGGRHLNPLIPFVALFPWNLTARRLSELVHVAQLDHSRC